jgi:hypothetical protein
MLDRILPALTVALLLAAASATWRLLRHRRLPVAQGVIIFLVLAAIGLLTATNWHHGGSGRDGREAMVAAPAQPGHSSGQATLFWHWQADPPTLRVVDGQQQHLLVVGLVGPEAGQRLREALVQLRETWPEAMAIPLRHEGPELPAIAAWCALQQIAATCGFRLLAGAGDS